MATLYGYRLQGLGESAEDFAASVAETERLLLACLQGQLAGYTMGGVFTDMAEQGSVPFKSRPAGGKLYGQVRRGDWVELSLSEAFQSAVDAARALETWTFCEIDFSLLDSEISIPDDAFSWMLRVAAGWELTRETARVRKGMATRRQTGKLLSGKVGPGLKIVGRRGYRKVVKDDKEQETIQVILHLHQEGLSYWDIRLRLIELGIRTRTGSQWTISRIDRAIKDASQPAMQA